jgi:anthranilate phosphoribosyltransferase
MAERMAGVLAELGGERALVFCGDDGLDELTTTTVSTVRELEPAGTIRTWTLDPADYGFARAQPGDLVGGDAAHNAEITKRILAGEAGPTRDVVVLNAAAALVVAGAGADFAGAVEQAQASIDDGHAADCLDAFVRTSVAAREAEGA